MGSGDIRLADLNGDGNLDLVSTDISNNITVALGTGQGRFGSLSSNNSGITPPDPALGIKASNGLTIGDLNGDGVLDVAMVATYYGGYGAILIGSTRNGISPIAPFSLKSRADALQAMGLFNRGARNLSDMQGTLGATQSRLAAAMGVVASARENTLAANSRIIDADIAADSANLTRTQILQQAGAAVLAQANLQPQLALRLLG
jgi:flagellin-like hook-associated protein FlgL